MTDLSCSLNPNLSLETLEDSRQPLSGHTCKQCVMPNFLQRYSRDEDRQIALSTFTVLCIEGDFMMHETMHDLAKAILCS